MKETDSKVLIESAELHTPMRIGGLTEANLNQARMAGISLYWTPTCLLVKFRGITSLVPHANVKFAILADNEKKPLKQ